MVIRPAGWEDLEAVAELIATQNRSASGIAGVQVEDVRHAWSLPGFVVGADHFVALDGERLTAYAAVSPGRELTLAGERAPVVDALLECVVSRSRERGYKAVTVTVPSPVSPLARLIARHPFELDRETLVMWRALVGPVAEATVPAGFTLGTYDPADAEAIHELLDTAYLAWDERYVPLAHADWLAFMTEDAEFDPTTWWIAKRAGRVAGCALFWNTGWLKDIAVTSAERGRGLGAALVHTGFAEFSRQGKRRVGLKVDASNPTGALSLYERCGFRAAGRESIWRLSL